MRSEYLQRYHACQLPEEEMLAVLRVLHFWNKDSLRKLATIEEFDNQLSLTNKRP